MRSTLWRCETDLTREDKVRLIKLTGSLTSASTIATHRPQMDNAPASVLGLLKKLPLESISALGQKANSPQGPPTGEDSDGQGGVP